MTAFPTYGWKESYGEVLEAIPPDMPTPLGKDIGLRMIVDNDYANNQRICRSWTRFVTFCNMALIAWVSTNQPTIQTSVFGAEFEAMKHGIEKLRGLRYNCRMMGFPYLDRPMCMATLSQPSLT